MNYQTFYEDVAQASVAVLLGSIIAGSNADMVIDLSLDEDVPGLVYHVQTDDQSPMFSAEELAQMRRASDAAMLAWGRSLPRFEGMEDIDI